MRQLRKYRTVLCAQFLLLMVLLSGCGNGDAEVHSGPDLQKLVREGKLSEAESECRKLVQQDPQKTDYRVNLAWILCLRGNAKLDEIGFFDVDLKARKSAEIVEKRGYDDAVGFFLNAAGEARICLEAEPRLARVRGTLGLALYRTDDTQGAIEELNRALADDPALAEAHNTLGTIYSEIGEKDKALTHYLAAVNAKWDLPEANYNLAGYYDSEFEERGKKEDQEHAIKYYRRFVKVGRGVKLEEVRARIKELEEGS